MNTVETRTSKAGAWRRLALVVAVLAGLITLGTWLPVDIWLDAARDWVSRNPLTGALLYVAAFVVGTVAMIPGSILTMSGGYLFGLFPGFFYVAIGSIVGSTLAAFLVRTVARNAVMARFESDPRFRAVDEAIGRRGLVIVILTRLSLVIPYNVVNAIYGLSRVRFWMIAVGTLIGMGPAVLLYVYLGSIARNVDQLLGGEIETGLAGKLLAVLGLAAIVATTFFVHRLATRALARELDENDASSTES